MDQREAIRMSWRSIRGHTLRSALTTLGVIIGVATVIVFITLGTSLQVELIGEVTGGREPVMLVWATPAGANAPPGAGAQPVFTARDVARINDTPGVAATLPRGTVSITAITRNGNTIAWSELTAVPPGYFEPDEFYRGHAYDTGAREIVINRAAAALLSVNTSKLTSGTGVRGTPTVENASVVRNAMGQNASVGETIRIDLGDKRINATIVGILNDSAGPFSGFGGGRPAFYVPLDPYYDTTSTVAGVRQQVYPLLVVRAESFAQVGAVQESIQSYLENDSDARLLLPASYEFAVRTNEELLDRIRELVSTLTEFIVAIAAVSLLVGSIGIANIMLVSVTERTGEIGIMKATGARRRDILQLFITEAVLLGVIGSVLGAFVGVLGSYALTAYVSLPLVLDPVLFVAAVAVGVGVGVCAGVYPAWRAARTDPIDALRYE